VAVTAVAANISEMSALRASLYIHIPEKNGMGEKPNTCCSVAKR